MQDGLPINLNESAPNNPAMPLHFDSQDDLDSALRALLLQDPRLQPVFDMVIEAVGHPALRRRAPGFAGLASTICGQQLSTFAAAAIWARMVETYDEVHHDHIRLARADKLRRLGLSVAKIKTLKFIAGEIAAGRLDLEKLADTSADEAHATLTALHGIGPWTADIYLLFCLGHGDAWPAGDLAVQEAIRIGLGLGSRPTVKEMATIGEVWRPYRGAAAHLFWSYYKVVKASGFDPMPPEKKAAKPAAKTKTATIRKAATKKKAPSATARKAAKPVTTKKPRKGPARHGR